MNAKIERDIRIILVVENNTPEGLISEHGFSAWIEVGDMHFLFDTGQGSALQHNAHRLGIELGQAEALILSHGHYDHTGAIPAFLAENSSATVLYGKGANVRRFSCHPNQPPKPVGISDDVIYALNQLPPERRIELDAPRYFAPGIGLTGPIPRLTLFEDTGGPFYLDENKKQPDLINDDLSLWFETTQGLVILTGCCHSGLINTVSYIRLITGIDRVHGIIGGLHLLNASIERLEATLRFLAEIQPDFLVPCHCTGTHVAELLLQKFGDAVVKPGGAGMKIYAGSQKTESVLDSKKYPTRQYKHRDSLTRAED